MKMNISKENLRTKILDKIDLEDWGSDYFFQGGLSGFNFYFERELREFQERKIDENLDLFVHIENKEPPAGSDYIGYSFITISTDSKIENKQLLFKI